MLAIATSIVGGLRDIPIEPPMSVTTTVTLLSDGYSLDIDLHRNPVVF